MNCSNCGFANPPASRFCRNCGQPLQAASQSATTSGVPPAVPGSVLPPEGAALPAFDQGSLSAWMAEARRYGWKRLWPLGALVLYVLFTRNLMVIVIGLVIAWGIRKYSNRIDEALSPVWPHRNRIPVRSRKVLGWVVPVGISLLISLVPAIWPFLGWLPVIGPTASLTVFTALIAALTAYVFVREPRRMETR
jgi:hypothetical protein